MGVRVRVNYNKLPDIAAKLPTEVDTVLDKFIHDVDAHATAETPVDTGALKNSKQIETARLRKRLSWGAAHAVHVHDGTRYMAARPFAADAVEKCLPSLTAALNNLEGRIV